MNWFRDSYKIQFAKSTLFVLSKHLVFSMINNANDSAFFHWFVLFIINQCFFGWMMVVESERQFRCLFIGLFQWKWLFRKFTSKWEFKTKVKRICQHSLECDIQMWSKEKRASVSSLLINNYTFVFWNYKFFKSESILCTNTISLQTGTPYNFHAKVLLPFLQPNFMNWFFLIGKRLKNFFS